MGLHAHASTAAFGPGTGPEYGHVSDLAPVFNTAPSRLLRADEGPGLWTIYRGSNSPGNHGLGSGGIMRQSLDPPANHGASSHPWQPAHFRSSRIEHVAQAGRRGPGINCERLQV